MTATSVLIRPVEANDAPAIMQLATLLDTMNLPRDREMITDMIIESTASFTRLLDSSASPGVPEIVAFVVLGALIS